MTPGRPLFTPLRPDVEPYGCYHQSRDKSWGFHSIKLVYLSFAAWRLRFPEVTQQLSDVAREIENISPPLQRRACALYHRRGDNSGSASQVRRFGAVRNSCWNFVCDGKLALLLISASKRSRGNFYPSLDQQIRNVPPQTDVKPHAVQLIVFLEIFCFLCLQIANYSLTQTRVK